MKKKVILAVAVMCIFNFIGCPSAKTEKQDVKENISDNAKVNLEYQQAFDRMCECLEQRYAYPYIEPGMSEKAYEKQKKKLEKQLSEITTLPELYCSFQGFVTQFNDMHTYIMMDYENEMVGEMFYYLPCTFKLFQKKWYMIACEEDKQQYLGWELVSINGFKMNELREKIAAFISAENTFFEDYSTAINLIQTDVLKYLQIVEDEQAPVKIVLRCIQNKEEKMIEVSPINYKERKIKEFARVQRAVKPITEPQGNYQAFTLNEQVYYIQINQCYSDPNNSISKFGERIVEEIKQQKPEQVLIDLRNNTGGDLNFPDKLIAWLKEPLLSENCEVYILIGNKTASAAVVTTINLHNEVKSILVGEPTGGKPNFNGATASRQLGTLPIRLQYTTAYIATIEDDDLMTLEPDIYAAQTFDDWKKGRDTAVDLILEK